MRIEFNPSINLTENIMATKKTPKAATTTSAPAAPAAPVSVEATPTTTTVEPVQLTIADLQLLARIVDLASRRGAFQAGELSQVGDAYNKLAGFLTYVESTQKKDEEAKVEAPAA
jgi:hypothetical protein